MSEQLSFMARLAIVQTELNVPKTQKNDFGGYNYRSAEDILAVVKPLLRVNDFVLTLSDEPFFSEGWHYIKATATLYDVDTDKVLSVVAYAREAASKKGMDDAQITGSASSYARKYALNGLFAIDDVKDADTNEYTQQARAAEKKAASDKELRRKLFNKLSAAMEGEGTTKTIMREVCNFKFGKSNASELDLNQLADLTENLGKYIDEFSQMKSTTLVRKKAWRSF